LTTKTGQWRYFNGVRIGGERLSRFMVQEWAIEKGVDVPCSFRKCPTQACDHHHHHGHHHDHSDDEDGHAGADVAEGWEDADEEMVQEDLDNAIFDCCNDDDSDIEAEVDFDYDMESDVYEDDE
jgi:hypothetical protein